MCQASGHRSPELGGHSHAAPPSRVLGTLPPLGALLVSLHTSSCHPDQVLTGHDMHRMGPDSEAVLSGDLSPV